MRSQAVDALGVVLEGERHEVLELGRLEAGRRIAQHRVAGRLPHAQLEPLGAGERGRRGELDERADHRRHQQPGAIRQRVDVGAQRRAGGHGGEQALAVGGEDDGDRVLARARALAPELLRAAAQVSPSRSLRRAVACGGAWTPPAAASSSARLIAGYGTGMARIRRRVRAHGKVQGVFFRDSTREEAERREVTGWVKNRGDGSVEAVFEGEPDMVEHMVWFVRNGPGSSDVSRVDVTTRSRRICAASR